MNPQLGSMIAAWDCNMHAWDDSTHLPVIPSQVMSPAHGIGQNASDTLGDFVQHLGYAY